jgi:orotate phosphoribosyltransferase
VVSTGAQAINAARKLDGSGAEVVKVVAVLDRRDEPEERLGEFPFQSLLKMDELRVGKRD